MPINLSIDLKSSGKDGFPLALIEKLPQKCRCGGSLSLAFIEHKDGRLYYVVCEKCKKESTKLPRLSELLNLACQIGVK